VSPFFFTIKRHVTPPRTRITSFCQTIWSEDKMFHYVISVVFSTETHIFLPDMPETRFLYIILFMTQRHTLII
jgi:hypothetical protein